MKNPIIFYLQLNEYATRKQLLAYLTQNGIHVTDRELRNTIKEMVERDGHAILSCGKGYKLISSAKEYQRAIDNLSSYIFSLLKRRKALKTNYNRLTATLIPSR